MVAPLYYHTSRDRKKILNLTVINESLAHCTFVESKESGVRMSSNFVISSLLQYLIILTMFIHRLYLELRVVKPQSSLCLTLNIYPLKLKSQL